jgi:hypothetical protein
MPTWSDISIQGSKCTLCGKKVHSLLVGEDVALIEVILKERTMDCIRARARNLISGELSRGYLGMSAQVTIAAIAVLRRGVLEIGSHVAAAGLLNTSLDDVLMRLETGCD